MSSVHLRNDANSRSRIVPMSRLSFQSVYQQYFNFVWASVRRFGVHPDATDDLVQEVFMVVHAKLEGLDKPSALRSWIYGVVRRTASNHRRTQRTQTSALLSSASCEDAQSTEPNPFEHLETNADLHFLASLLAELDEPKREIFAMVELDELTVPEVAEVLDIPLNTAYSRLRSARQAFEAAVNRRGQRSKGI